MYKIRKELETGFHPSSAKSRDELDEMLADLDATLPLLIAQNPDSADFMPLFADRVDGIVRHASAADHEWLIDRVHAVLEKNGQSDDEYLLPHDLLTV
jgi:hypothetical protein